MAKVEPKNNDRLSGVLVSKDFHYHIMDAKELSEFTDVNTTEIIQKQKISFHGTFSLVIFHLEQMFGEIKIIDKESILVYIKFLFFIISFIYYFRLKFICKL